MSLEKQIDELENRESDQQKWRHMEYFGREKLATHEKLQPLVAAANVSNMLTVFAGDPLTSSEDLQQGNAAKSRYKKVSHTNLKIKARNSIS